MKKKLLLLVFIYVGMLFHSNAAALNLTLFIQGYYIGSGQMEPLLLNWNICSTCFTSTDTITVELHDQFNPSIIVASNKPILQTDGTAFCNFPNSVIGNAYYIAVKHRSTVETWSAAPVLMSASTSYDFTNAVTKAYGNNMILVDTAPDRWGFYQGDIIHEGNVDQIDDVPMDYALNHGFAGYYDTDLDGDGGTTLLDFVILQTNICLGIYSHHP